MWLSVLYKILLVSLCLFLTTACSTAPIKDGMKIGALTTGAATVAAVLSPAAAAPILAAGVASTVSGAVVSATSADDCKPANITADTVVTEAPDTIWTVAQRLVELGGISLLLIFVIVPLLTGWLIPGPTKLNRREKK